MIFRVVKFLITKLWGVTMEKIMAKIVEKMLGQMSGELRAQIESAISRLEVTAKATKNPWDDILVLILKVALDIK